MQTIFVLFGSVELSGTTRPEANKDKVTEYYIQHVVDWKDKSFSDKIDDAKLKKEKLTGNGDMPVPPWSSEFVSLTKLGSDIVDADKRLMLHLLKMPNSKKNLTVAVNLLNKDVKSIGTLLQVQMDAAPTNDESIRICLDAGYNYKAIRNRGKRKNAVKQSTEPGVLVVEGEGAGGRQWQMSADASHSVIIDLPPTTSGVIVVRDLVPYKQYWFRWRLVLTKGKYGDWSNWFFGFAP